MSPRRKPKSPAADPTDAVGAGQKPVGSDPEPVVGAKADVPEPEDQSAKLDCQDHGRKAEVDLAAERSQEAKRGEESDSSTSAEAADQGEVSKADVRRSEAASAAKAADLASIESEVGREALELGITAAGDREDHLRAVTVAARAAQAAFNEGSGNVARARAFAAVEALPAVDSPHGRVAEDHDPWANARWAPHGDQNVPADSDALSNVAQSQARGLDPESDNEAADEFSEGEDVAKAIKAENREALKVGRAEKVDYPEVERIQRRHVPQPDASEA